MEHIEALAGINFTYVFILVCTILAGAKFATSLFEWFVNKLGLETKWMRREREQKELLEKTVESVNSLSKGLDALTQKHEQDIKDMYENNLKYRDQSREIRADLKCNIENVSNKLDNMIEKNNKRIRAELKDRIGQSYRYYHEKQKINDIELEALEDLIASYESANGENSFVHSLVQKEMYTWEKVIRK